MAAITRKEQLMATARAVSGPDTEESAEDEAAEIRFSLTALGEAVLTDQKRSIFAASGPAPPPCCRAPNKASLRVVTRWRSERIDIDAW